MSKIQLSDSIHDVFYKLSEGNPGALSVLMEIWKRGKEIDPDTEPLFILFDLDTDGIYGPSIWMLFKNVCGESLHKTIALLRAVQMGILGRNSLLHAINNRGVGVNVDEVYRKVRKELPNFQLEPEAT